MRVGEALIKLDHYNPNAKIRIKNIFNTSQRILPVENIVAHTGIDACVLKTGAPDTDDMPVYEISERLKRFPPDALLKVGYQFADELRFLDVVDIWMDCSGLFLEARERPHGRV